MSFSLDVSEFAQLIDKRALYVQRGVAIDLFSKVVIRTPVDIGTLRANWRPSVNKPNKSKTKKTDPSGQETIALIKKKFEKARGDRFILTNNLPYAPIVEYGLYPSKGGGETAKTINGYSKQAPKGMVRVTLAEFLAAIRKKAREAKGIT